MRIVASLFLTLIGTLANASVHLVHVQFLSLDKVEDRWVLAFMSYGMFPESSDVAVPTRAILELRRQPECVRDSAKVGSQQEYEQALQLLHKQLAAGSVVRFGLDAHPVPGNPNKYIAVDLRLFGADVVWSIGPDVGREHCPFKVAA